MAENSKRRLTTEERAKKMAKLNHGTKALGVLELTPQAEMHQSLLSLRQKGEYSDFTILCGERTFKVHKSIVCPRSEFFAKAFNGNFKESALDEIRLEDDIEVVEKMLDYLYQLDYDDGGDSTENEEDENDSTDDEKDEKDSPGDEGDESHHPDVEEQEAKEDGPLFLNARLYALADKYFMPGLKVLSKNKFQKRLEGRKVRLTIREITCPPRQVLYESRKSISALAQLVYTSTPSADRELRVMVTKMAQEHGNTLLRSHTFRAVLESVPDFALDLLHATWTNSTDLSSNPKKAAPVGRVPKLISPFGRSTQP